MTLNLENGRSEIPNSLLMIPGPVEVADNVLEAMGKQVISDCGFEFSKLYLETLGHLKNIFKTKGDVFLLACSGSGGIESAIGSVFSPGDSVLVIDNGFFGNRLKIISQSMRLKVFSVKSTWDKPISISSVRKLIIKTPQITGVLAVHHETSTGILNPMRELGEMCIEYDKLFLVDAIASLGGEELCMDDWGIDICVTSSNKCLESLAGFAPVAVSEKALEIIYQNINPSTGWYLNLQVWHEHLIKWEDWHPAPVTIPTNNLLALVAALANLRMEGLDNRIKRYKDAATLFREQILKLGYELFIEDKYASSVITSVMCNENTNVDKLISFIRKDTGIRIAGKIGDFEKKIFRVGHIGRASSQKYINLLIESLRRFSK